MFEMILTVKIVRFSAVFKLEGFGDPNTPFELSERNFIYPDFN